MRRATGIAFVLSITVVAVLVLSMIRIPEVPIFPGVEATLDGYPAGWELGHILIFSGGSWIAGIYWIDNKQAPPTQTVTAWHSLGIHYAHVASKRSDRHHPYTYWTLAISYWYALIPASLVASLTGLRAFCRTGRPNQSLQLTNDARD